MMTRKPDTNPAKEPDTQGLYAKSVRSRIDDQILDSGLSMRQHRFVTAYFSENTIQDAAIAAGYKPNTARTMAPRWLDVSSSDFKPKTHAAILKRQKAISEAHFLHIDELVADLIKVAFADLLDFVDPETGNFRDIESIPKDARRCIDVFEKSKSEDGKFKIRLKLRSKDQAIDMLMKFLGAYEQQNQHGARRFVVLATPAPQDRSSADAQNSGSTFDPQMTAQQRNYAEMERTNEWVIENDLPDPIIIESDQY
jgi:phage terminase small subunit